MTATDELRRLLDERGVLNGYEDETVWWTLDGETLYNAREIDVLGEPSGCFEVWDLSPEQAVEATLGRGECRITNRRKASFRCSGCNVLVPWPFEVASDPHYCPNCGRKVVDA